jgi:hypothetical protein
MTDVAKIQVTKLEAAQRQLHCAIELWFRDADLVSTHTLARAAYDVVHDLNEKRGMTKDLLYNSDTIKDEYQEKWAALLRQPGNFAKHADRDPEGIAGFDSFTTLVFMMFTIRGLHALGVQHTPQTLGLGFWLALHDPKVVKEDFRKLVIDRIPVEGVTKLRTIPKSEFLEGFISLSEFLMHWRSAPDR